MKKLFFTFAIILFFAGAFLSVMGCFIYPSEHQPSDKQIVLGLLAECFWLAICTRIIFYSVDKLYR